MNTGAVITDRLDRLIWQDISQRSQEIQNLETELATETFPAINALTQDLWAGAYKIEPALKPSAATSPLLTLERKLIQKLLASPQFQQLREITILDESLAAAIVPGLTRRLVQALPEAVRQAAQKAARQQAQAETLQVLADNLADIPGQEIQAQAAQAEAQTAAQNARQAAAEATAAFDAAAETIIQAATQAVGQVKETTQAIKEAAEAYRGWGRTTGQLKATAADYTEIARLMEKNVQLQQIIRLAGRFTQIVMKKRATQVKKKPCEIAEIETGNNLSQVLSQELTALAHPVRKKDFYRRYAERKLMQHRLEAKNPEGKGALVFCLDESGSMTGQPEIWSKAVALAMMNLARKEKRVFVLIHFGSRSEIRIDRFLKPRQAGLDEILKALAFFFNGGTDFERPLREAVKIMAESPLRKGDVIFITDGECQVSVDFISKFTAIKQEKDFSVFTILMRNAPETSVKPFSDKITRLKPGKNDREVLECLVQGS